MTNLHLTTKEQDSILIITVSGEINANNTLGFRKYIAKNFPTFKKNTIFDLSGLEYINSMGVGTLIKTIKEIQHTKHKACLVGLNENILQILRITGLIAILNHFDTIEDALKFLK